MCCLIILNVLINIGLDFDLDNDIDLDFSPSPIGGITMTVGGGAGGVIGLTVAKVTKMDPIRGVDVIWEVWCDLLWWRDLLGDLSFV
jgi:hypothetical protein